LSLLRMHSAKGLEWPIVIPINSPTELDETMDFLHRRSDNTVHFKLMGAAGSDYDVVKADEKGQLQRERVRLWYVALARACDIVRCKNQVNLMLRCNGSLGPRCTVGLRPLPCANPEAWREGPIWSLCDRATHCFIPLRR